MKYTIKLKSPDLKSAMQNIIIDSNSIYNYNNIQLSIKNETQYMLLQDITNSITNTDLNKFGDVVSISNTDYLTKLNPNITKSRLLFLRTLKPFGLLVRILFTSTPYFMIIKKNKLKSFDNKWNSIHPDYTYNVVPLEDDTLKISFYNNIEDVIFETVNKYILSNERKHKMFKYNLEKELTTQFKVIKSL